MTQKPAPDCFGRLRYWLLPGWSVHVWPGDHHFQGKLFSWIHHP